ncbi:MAG TPA: serine/threonine-protein kinase, partial [Ktedonobacteraceae bacterium]|nr:serine/threonine-protein kinase [Ktedonobacteraceae bacterium]
IGERLERELILGYAWDIAEALEYIHGQNYIHRDLKPENLLIGQDGQILVSDFGIAIAVQETWGVQEQESVGTLPYMAPEQIMGRPCLASDQYALGVIIYEWLSGELPFDEDSADLAWQHLNVRPIRLRRWLPDLPEAVEQVILKALEKDPRKRFRSVVDFISHLEDAWKSAPALVHDRSFYEHTTYKTETPQEIPALQRSSRLVFTEKREGGQGWSKQKSWKIATGSFALDLLLGLITLICAPDLDWSFIKIGMSVIIAGLPLSVGVLWKDQRTLTLAAPVLCLELASVWAFPSPLIFFSISIVGSTLCAIMAFTLYLRFF